MCRGRETALFLEGDACGADGDSCAGLCFLLGFV
jgi:hypothetical protein